MLSNLSNDELAMLCQALDLFKPNNSGAVEKRDDLLAKVRAELMFGEPPENAPLTNETLVDFSRRASEQGHAAVIFPNSELHGVEASIVEARMIEYGKQAIEEELDQAAEDAEREQDQ